MGGGKHAGKIDGRPQVVLALIIAVNRHIGQSANRPTGTEPHTVTNPQEDSPLRGDDLVAAPDDKVFPHRRCVGHGQPNIAVTSQDLTRVEHAVGLGQVDVLRSRRGQ